MRSHPAPAEQPAEAQRPRLHLQDCPRAARTDSRRRGSCGRRSLAARCSRRRPHDTADGATPVWGRIGLLRRITPISIKRAAPAVQQLRSLSSQHLARSCRISADPVLSSERTARKALNVASGSVGNLVFGAIIAAMEGEYGNHEGRAGLDCWVAGIRSPSLAGGLLWAPGPGWESPPRYR